MRYNDPIAEAYQEQLEENFLRNLAIGGAIGVSAALLSNNNMGTPDYTQQDIPHEKNVKDIAISSTDHVKLLAGKIKEKYKVSPELADKVAGLAKKT